MTIIKKIINIFFVSYSLFFLYHGINRCKNTKTVSNLFALCSDKLENRRKFEERETIENYPKYNEGELRFDIDSFSVNPFKLYKILSEHYIYSQTHLFFKNNEDYSRNLPERSAGKSQHYTGEIQTSTAYKGNLGFTPYSLERKHLFVFQVALNILNRLPFLAIIIEKIMVVFKIIKNIIQNSNYTINLLYRYNVIFSYFYMNNLKTDLLTIKNDIEICYNNVFSHIVFILLLLINFIFGKSTIFRSLRRKIGLLLRFAPAKP